MSTEDEDVYTDPASSSHAHRESVRPFVQELNASAATYDADSLHWPSSAKVSHGVAPPSLGKAKGKAKSVRIAQPTEQDIRYYHPQPKAREEVAQRRVQVQDDEDNDDGPNFNDMTPGRFVLPLEGEGEGSSQSSGREPSRQFPTMPSLPMVGGIQERRPAGSSPSKAPSLPTGASRFKAMKQAERQRNIDPQASASPRRHAPPVVRERVTLTGDVDDNVPRAVRDAEALASSSGVDGDQGDDEWLDENGNVMSAFRKARLQRQGQGPPGGTRPGGKGGTAAQQFTSPAPQSEPTDTSELLDSISQENEAKVRAMSATDVQSDLADLRAVFGQDTLDGLRDRKKTSAVATGSPQQDAQDMASMLQTISRENEQKIKNMRPEDVQSDLRDLEKMFGRDMLEGLRSRKVASGADAKGSVPCKTGAGSTTATPSVETRQSVSSMSSTTPSDSILFDTTGRLLPNPSSSQHRHGGHEDHAHPHYGADPTDPNREGYTCESLLLLCRSTVAGQRVMALNMVGRVCSLYGEHLSYGDVVSQDKLTLEPGQVPSVSVVATILRKAQVHLNTALTSIMLLNDRQRSVRHAALSCLRTALLFGGTDKWVGRGTDNESTFIQKLVDAGLFAGLSNVLQDGEELTLSRELSVQILLQLGRADVNVLYALLNFHSGKLLATMVTHCLKTHWPPTRSASHRLPSPSCAILLHEIVASSRANAERLIKSEVLDVLLRFLAVGPWTIGTDFVENDGDDEHEQLIGYELLSETLAIYHSLARYGLYASLVSRAWELFEALQQLIHKGAIDGQTSTPSPHLARLRTTIAWRFYRLLSMWTTCATDPHQTTPEHEVTWSQVEDWIEPSLDLLEILLSKGDVSGNGDAVKVLAGVCGHVVAWLQCASKNGPQHKQSVAGILSSALERHAKVFDDLCASLQFTDSRDADDGEADETDKYTRFADTCDACCQLLSVAHAIGNDSLASRMASAANRSDCSRALSALSELQDPREHLAVASLVFQVRRGSKGDLLRLLSCLVPGEERLALEIIECLLSCAAQDNTHLADIDLRSCLRPFFAECLGIRPNPTSEAKRQLKYAPATTTPIDLKRTLSLRRPPRPEEDKEEEEKDPVTGSALWKSPASHGLPLRPDWALLALDDLLRSAECAVFNRADNLPVDWDPNERQVVQATLVFNNWCCAGDDGLEGKPTSTHLYLAAQKVFMLESGIQGDMRKWTGAVTGKDLFRDSAIAPHLRDMITVHAAKLAESEVSQSPPTLDEVAPQHFGSDTSYYSFYTDLIGLYDSISYGDLSFALALLPPLAVRGVTNGKTNEGYPIDYRRLLWKDYSHLLPTIRVSEAQAPGGIGKYLSSRHAQQEDRTIAEETEMLQAYTSAVLTDQIGPQYHGFLWRIAVHHIASAIWNTEQRTDSRAQSLAGAIFSQGSRVLQDSILAYQCDEEGSVEIMSEVDLEARRKWLRLHCGCDV